MATLVFNHMRCKFITIFGPFVTVQFAAGAQAVSRAIGHRKGMMGVVMGKEPLTAKDQQPIEAAQPLIDLVEMVFVA